VILNELRWLSISF